MEDRKRRVIRYKRKTVVRVLLIAAAVVVLVGVAAAVLLLRKTATPEVQVTDAPFGVNDPFVYTGTGFWHAQQDTLYYDEIDSDKSDFSLQVSASAFKLAASATVQTLYNDASLKIVGEQFPVEFTGKLLSVKCGVGYVAALRSDVNGQESIQVFEKTGATRDQIPGGDAHIMDYGFFTAESEYLYVLSMSLKSSTPMSTIRVYNITNKSTSGVMQVQSQLIGRMCFTKSGIFALGTNQIIRYALADNQESFRVTVYGFEVMDADPWGDKMCFLLRPRGGSVLGTVKLIQAQDAGTRAVTERIVQLPAGTLGAFLMNGRLVAVAPGGYTLYDMTGKQLSEFRFPSTIEGVQKLDSTLLMLRAGSQYMTTRIG